MHPKSRLSTSAGKPHSPPGARLDLGLAASRTLRYSIPDVEASLLLVLCSGSLSTLITWQVGGQSPELPFPNSNVFMLKTISVFQGQMTSLRERHVRFSIHRRSSTQGMVSPTEKLSVFLSSIS